MHRLPSGRRRVWRCSDGFLLCLFGLVLLLGAGSSLCGSAAIAEPSPAQERSRERALDLAHEYLVGQIHAGEPSDGVVEAGVRPSLLTLRCLRDLALYCSGRGDDRYLILERQIPLLSVLEARSTQVDAQFLWSLSWFNVLIAVMQSDEAVPQRYVTGVRQSCITLLQLQGADGLWRSVKGRNDPAGATLAALLGLWACTRLGLEVPPSKLRSAASGLVGLTRQCDAGSTGFVREQSVGSHVEGHDTAAGVLGLFAIAHMLGSQGENIGAQAKRSIERGLLWIDAAFNVQWNPAWYPRDGSGQPEPNSITFVGAAGGHMAWLFRVALLAACLDLEEVCGRDLAGKYSMFLLSSQQGDGSWLLKRDARTRQDDGLYPTGSMRLRSSCLGVLVLAGEMLGHSLTDRHLEVSGKPRAEEEVAPPEWAHVGSVQIEASARLLVPVAMENKWKMRFVLIPAGRYRMGSPPGESGRVLGMEETHSVLITRPFYMQICEVTNDVYRLYHRDHDSGELRGYRLNRGNHPAVWESWEEASAFAEWLTREDGKVHYRLPTEAEWEWACRAGSTSRWSWGDSDAAGAGHANARGRGEGADWDARFDGWREDDGYYGPAPVCSYSPNPWGLYDMHGNVAEFCLDWLVASGRAPLLIDPCVRKEDDAPAMTVRYDDRAGLSHQYVGRLRACRGGSWASSVGETRCAARGACPPTVGHWARGFRLVVTIVPEPDEE